MEIASLRLQSGKFDVSQAKKLQVNADSKTTYQGQTHGHKGFLLDHEEGETLLSHSPEYRTVVFPYLTADELLRTVPPTPQRFVIDFYPKDVLEAQTYSEPFSRVETSVLPDRESAAKKERIRNKEALSDNPNARINRHHANFLKKWWQLSYPRGELMYRLGQINRYIVCSRVTKRPVFVFLSTEIHPSDALQVFTFDDDYSFGILQSSTHWEWFVARCSTLKGDFRYTSNTVYDSFPGHRNQHRPRFVRSPKPLSHFVNYANRSFLIIRFRFANFTEPLNYPVITP